LSAFTLPRRGNFAESKGVFFADFTAIYGPIRRAKTVAPASRSPRPTQRKGLAVIGGGDVAETGLDRDGDAGRTAQPPMTQVSIALPSAPRNARVSPLLIEIETGRF
jgi:hypothetical protein